MDRLSPLDSLFLHVEDGVTHMHIGSCAIFEGPAPPYAEVVKLVERKLPRLTRYRQKVRFVPGELGRPVWIDDCHFNLAYHVRHSALPPPGGPDELNALMGRLMAVELDRHRPLWEVWMIEGLTGGRWAVISKVHHCMVDGISGTDLMVVLLDPTDPPSTGSDGWTPAPEPSAVDLAVDGVLELLRTPAEQVRAVRAMLRGPRRALAEAGATLAGAIALGRNLQPTPTLSIEGAIGPHRRWSSASASLEDLKAIRSALGGTVNDVILAVLSGAFRDLMESRGDPVDGTLLRTLVPVSIRAAGDRTANNQVSVIIAELPVGVADPVERLAATRRQMDRLKGSHQAEAGEVATTLAAIVPPTLYALTLRSASAALRRFPQRSVHTVTTNVPGPREALSALGREMVEYLPFVPLSQGTRIGVAILSYNGQVRFGVTGDYDTMPEVDWFCSRIETAVAELLSRSGVRRRRHAKASSTGARAARGPSRPLTAVRTRT